MALPDDGRRYEVIDGLLLREPPPATSHQVVLRRLVRQLLQQLGPEREDGLLFAPVGVRLARDTVLQPDALYVRPERHHLIGEQVVEGAPDAVFEVLSPSTRQRDLLAKRHVYARHGVAEYWVLDPAARRVYLWTEPAPGGFGALATFAPGQRASSLVLGCTLDVGELFGPYRGWDRMREPPLPPDPGGVGAGKA